jgi:hypothetical protein
MRLKNILSAKKPSAECKRNYRAKMEAEGGNKLNKCRGHNICRALGPMRSVWFGGMEVILYAWMQARNGYHKNVADGTRRRDVITEVCEYTLVAA